MKVYRVNDFEWYMAPTLEEAVAKCMADCQLPRDEATDNPRECTPEEMQRLEYQDLHSGEVRTFAEELEMSTKMLAHPPTRLFATTEF